MTPTDTAVLIVPPFLVATIAGWLGHDGFPKWVNAAISFIVIALVAVVSALLSNQLVGGSLWSSIAIVGALCAALAAGPLAPLQQWLLKRTPSPLVTLGLFHSHIVDNTATHPMPQVVTRTSTAFTPVRTVTFPASEPSSSASNETDAS